jgi:hypothetical protein
MNISWMTFHQELMDTVEATVQRILGSRAGRVCSKGYLAGKVSRGDTPRMKTE